MSSVVLTFVGAGFDDEHAHVVAVIAGARVPIVSASQYDTDVLVEDVAAAIAGALGTTVDERHTPHDDCLSGGDRVTPGSGGTR